MPGALGYWLDQWLGTKAVFLVLGVVLGFATGMWQLVNLSAAKDQDKPRRETSTRGDEQDQNKDP